MTHPTKPYIALFAIVCIICLEAFKNKPALDKKPTSFSNIQVEEPKIQVAILLDVSGSMDGLIEQAKAQLWNMASTMGKATCQNGKSPLIEIALYEYGRTTNDAKLGYVKKINGFINDLDSLSGNLFSLKTDGGEEYCGQVIYTSIKELAWDNNDGTYKVIFIAGNEDFLQGNLQYTKACNEAKQKGVIVNTIYCGDKMQGVREHWNLAGECGNGSYTNINQNAREVEIPTPYDSLLYVLNDKLNATYISYGASGDMKLAKQKQMDYANTTMGKSVGIKRISVKGKKGLYQNTDWDLVDAAKDKVTLIDDMDLKALPDSLRTKTRAEIKTIVTQKSVERNTIQTAIANASIEREKFIAAEKAKLANTGSVATLETEIEKIIKEQAKRFNMTIQ